MEVPHWSPAANRRMELLGQVLQKLMITYNLYFNDVIWKKVEQQYLST